MTNAADNSRRADLVCILVLAAAAFALMIPVLRNGIPNGHDLPHHYQCAMTFVDSIRDGVVYPSWSANRNFGYGGMETRLYPPVSHFLLALSFLAVGDWHVASWLLFMLISFAGSLGVYLWARETQRPVEAAFAGCFYALVPYHVSQIYNTFFFAEFAGCAVLPFVFLFVSRVLRRGTWADVGGLAAAYALLILTHLPLTVIGSFCFAVYGLTLLSRERLASQATRTLAGVGLALAASSFFWTKVLLERDLMAKATVYADPWLDYRLNFLLTPLQRYEGFAVEVYENGTYFYDLMLLYVVIATIAAALPFFFGSRRFETKEKGVWFLLAIGLFMTTPFSSFVWASVPVLREVQFPWRWLAIVAVAAALAAGSKFGELIEWFRGARRPFALVAAGGLLAMAAFSIGQLINQATYVATKDVAPTMATTATSVGLTFWWPVWARKEALEVKEKVVADGRAAAPGRWTATEKNFRLDAGREPGRARVAVFYHPSWKAFVDGVPAAASPAADGALTVAVPASAAEVAIRFVEPRPVAVARPVSVAASVAILLAFIVPFAAGLRRPRD